MASPVVLFICCWLNCILIASQLIIQKLNYWTEKYRPVQLAVNLCCWATEDINWAVNKHCKVIAQYPHASSLAGDLRIMCIFWFVTTQFKMWSLGDVSCIGSKVDYQDESLTLPLCLVMPYWHYQLVLGLYLYQSESYQLSFNNVSHSLSDIGTHRSDPRYTWVR